MLETKIVLLQITNARARSVSDISGPNSIAISDGKEEVEFGIRVSEEASEFYKEYWVVDSELYVYLDDRGDVYIYNDDLERFEVFVDALEHVGSKDFIYEGVYGDVLIDSIDLYEGSLRFMSGGKTIFSIGVDMEEAELFETDYDKLFERMRLVYGK